MCELNDMASSGADEPNATTVKPMMVVDTLKFLASDAAPSTKMSAHLINIKNPATVSIIFNITFNHHPLTI